MSKQAQNLKVASSNVFGIGRSRTPWGAVIAALAALFLGPGPSFLTMLAA
jgi:hypothetical protein